MNKKPVILSIATSIVLAACGGGGGSTGEGGASVNDSTGTTSAAVKTGIPGIAGMAGSTCAFQAVPETRVLDMDKSGYVTWLNGRVACTLADGSIKNIGGLPITAFALTGNGVISSAPEDLVMGTSSVDGAPTYSLQVYRHFASAASVTYTNEALTIKGQDSLGQTINAQQVVSLSNGALQGLDDWANLTRDETAGGTVSPSRVIDADGMGYMATTYVVAMYARHLSTSPSCPVGSGVKDYASITTDQSRRTVDVRYCMYTALDISSFSYTDFAFSTSYAGSWRWQLGADAGTTPTLAIQTVAVEPVTLSLLRTPIYKVVTSVRFPKVPSPNFDGVEGAGPGWIAGHFPQFPSSSATFSGIPSIWNR